MRTFKEYITEGYPFNNFRGYLFKLEDGTITMYSKDKKELDTREYPSLTSVQMKSMIKEYEKNINEAKYNIDIHGKFNPYIGVDKTKLKNKIKSFNKQKSDLENKVFKANLGSGGDKKAYFAEIEELNLKIDQANYIIKSKPLQEAKSPKHFIGKSDGMNFAVQLEGFDNMSLKGGSFGDQVRMNKFLKPFKKEAKSTRVGSKGKATLASVKAWVKENNPSEFFAKWKPDSSSYKDDSIEIFYKVSINEEILTED